MNRHVKFLYDKYAKTKVDPAGLEPATFSMPLRRAPNCAMGPKHITDTMDLAGFEPATSSVRVKRAPSCATGPTYPLVQLI